MERFNFQNFFRCREIELVSEESPFLERLNISDKLFPGVERLIFFAKRISVFGEIDYCITNFPVWKDLNFRNVSGVQRLSLSLKNFCSCQGVERLNILHRTSFKT